MLNKLFEEIQKEESLTFRIPRKIYDKYQEELCFLVEEETKGNIKRFYSNGIDTYTARNKFIFNKIVKKIKEVLRE